MSFLNCCRACDAAGLFFSNRPPPPTHLQSQRPCTQDPRQSAGLSPSVLPLLSPTRTRLGGNDPKLTRPPLCDATQARGSSRHREMSDLAPSAHRLAGPCRNRAPEEPFSVQRRKAVQFTYAELAGVAEATRKQRALPTPQCASPSTTSPLPGRASSSLHIDKIAPLALHDVVGTRREQCLDWLWS
jgi:hypothetical protein